MVKVVVADVTSGNAPPLQAEDVSVPLNLNKAIWRATAVCGGTDHHRCAEMSRVVDFCQNCLHAFLDYETTKTLVIPNLRVGCIFRFIQILILLYVVGWVKVWRGMMNTRQLQGSFWSCCLLTVTGTFVWWGSPTRRTILSSAPWPPKWKDSPSPTVLTWMPGSGMWQIM